MAARITGQTLVVDGGATIRELWGISEDALPRFQSGNYEVRPG
jgi:3-oxoacyl-[acyl-carrier protein] reductase